MKRRRSATPFILALCFVIMGVVLTKENSISAEESFKVAQLKFKRVRQAYKDKEEYLKGLLKEKGISSFSFQLFIRGFKDEKTLEIWVRPLDKSSFIHLKDYDFCASSGSSGPKRREGDGQIPEGFYQINRFNPASNFYLSLGLNYPNQADMKKSQRPRGGDIFIHGNCVTIGCIPITDDKIKELYLLAVEARNSGQKNIPVHIFPCKFSGSHYPELRKSHQSEHTLLAFWKSLEPGYTYFETQKTVPKIAVDAAGEYQCPVCQDQRPAMGASQN